MCDSANGTDLCGGIATISTGDIVLPDKPILLQAVMKGCIEPLG